MLRVCVLAHRNRYWERILTGECNVGVGAVGAGGDGAKNSGDAAMPLVVVGGASDQSSGGPDGGPASECA